MKVSLETHQGTIAVNPFVERLIAHVLGAILSSLHTSGPILDAEFILDSDGVRIHGAGKEIELINPYARNTIADVLRAILKNLKGVDWGARAIFHLTRRADEVDE